MLNFSSQLIDILHGHGRFVCVDLLHNLLITLSNVLSCVCGLAALYLHVTRIAHNQATLSSAFV